MKYEMTASIVLYHSDPTEIKHVMGCFLNSELRVKLYLIDNSPSDDLRLLGNNDNVEYIKNKENIGFGAAHNVALKQSANVSEFHLILNPDVSFKSSILPIAYKYMMDNHEVGLLSPSLIFPDGSRQYMCRRIPTPFDFFARRFFPRFLKKFFKRELDAYLLKDLDYTKIHNIPNLPGSFMVLRNSAITKVGGFDENIFMYNEDIDLTRRMFNKFKTIYFPAIEVTHALAQGSYRSKKLLIYHIRSSIYYFNKWGWFYDIERKEVNKKLKLILS
jgi:GT2 family glycosyltransferase